MPDTISLVNTTGKIAGEFTYSVNKEKKIEEEERKKKVGESCV